MQIDSEFDILNNQYNAGDFITYDGARVSSEKVRPLLNFYLASTADFLEEGVADGWTLCEFIADEGG
jgi:hypothetical protein